LVPLADTFVAGGSALTTPAIAYTADGKAVITATAHGVAVGEIRMVRVAGATPAALNGDFIALSLSSSTLQYFVKGISSAGSATGTITVNKGDTTALTLSFNTLTAANFFGFDLQRFQTSAEVGFTKGAVPTDVMVSVLEDQVGGSAFNPDAHITDFYAIYIRFANSTDTAGTKLAYLWISYN